MPTHPLQPQSDPRRPQPPSPRRLRRAWPLFACLLLLFLTGARRAQAQGVLIDPHWNTSNPIPGDPTADGSCVTSGGYIYCVGGSDNSNTYFAALTPAGVGRWQQTTSYPEGGEMQYATCVADNGYIYCIAGYNQGGESNAVTSDVWFAPLSSSGIGAWTKTIGYGLPYLINRTELEGPVPGLDVYDHSCVAAGEYVYCIGGTQATISTGISNYGGVSQSYNYSDVNYVLYSHAGSTGVDGWVQATSYPETITGESCVTANGYIYCVGGNNSQLTGQNVSDVFYTQIQGDGSLGSWTQTTAYGGGGTAGLSCAVTGPNITCAGGNNSAVWTAPLSANGVGTWTQEPSFPETVAGSECVANGGQIDCVGGGLNGGDNAVHFAFYTSNLVVSDPATCNALLGVWSSDNPPTCTVSAQLETLDGGQLTIAGETTLWLTSNAGFANSGSLDVEGYLVNQGQVVSAAPILNNGNVDNQGYFDAGGAVTNNATFEDSGTLNIPSNASFLNNGTVYQDCSGTITGTVSGNAVQSTCDSTTSALNLQSSSMPNGATVTITDTVTDTSGTQPFSSTPQFQEIRSGGSFGPVSCAGTKTLVCTVSFTTPLANGDDTIVATYQDGSHKKSQTAIDLTYTGIPTTTTLASSNPAAAGQPVIVTATVSPAPAGGTVAFSVNGSLYVDAPVSNGIASTGISFSAGTSTVTASYSGVMTEGSVHYLGSSASYVQSADSVIEIKDQASCSSIGGSWTAAGSICQLPNLSLSGANSLQIDAGVTATMPVTDMQMNAGAVVINHGTLVLAPGVSNTNVFGTTLILESGASLFNTGTISNQGVISVFPGGSLTNSGRLDLLCGGLLGGTVTGTPAVAGCDATATTISPAPAAITENVSTTLTATITDTVTPSNYPVAPVLWTLNGIVIGACLPAHGSCSIGFVVPATLGPATIQAAFSATLTNDPNHLASAATLTTQIVSPTSTTLSAAPNPSSYGQPVTLSSLVSGSSGGSVTYFDGTTPLGAGPVNSSGQANATVSQLTPGTHRITAVYSGSGNAGISTSTSVSEAIAPNPQEWFQQSTITKLPGFALRVAVADFNHDGQPDLAIVDGASNLTIWLGNGDGTFRQGASYTLPIGGLQAIAAADFNGDGNTDLVVGGSLASAGGVYLLLGNGDGTFASPVAIGNSPVTDLAVADLNCDGHVDIVAAEFDNIAAFLGHGDGTFSAPVLTPASVVQNVVVGDLNGDGIPDLAVETPGQLTIEIGMGDGTFRAGQSIPIAVGLNVNNVLLANPVLADFNGDGKLDLAVTDGYGGGVLVFLGNGDGTFQAPTQYATPDKPTSLVAGDFNADGKIDLAVVNLYSLENGSNNGISILPGNGDGTFGTPITYPVNALLLIPVVGDFGGNGLVSILDVDPNGDLIELPGQALQAQTISFSQPANTVYGSGPVSLTASASSGLPVTIASATPTICTVSGNSATVLSGGICTLTATQSGNATYSAAPSVTVQFTISPESQTVTFPAIPNVVYGAGPVALSATASSTLAVTYGSTTLNVCTLNGRTVVIVGGGVCSLTASQAGNQDYAPASATESFTVTPAPASLTWPPPAAVAYGTPLGAAQLDVSVNGKIAGSVTYSPAAGTVLGAGTTQLTATFTPSNPADYVSSTAIVNLAVNPLVPTLSVSAGPFVYSGSPKSASFAVTGLGGVSVAGTVAVTYTPGGATAPIAAGQYGVSVTFTSSNPNYTNASASATLVIAPAALVIKANNAERRRDRPNPPFTASFSGFQGTDNASTLSGKLDFTTPATRRSPLGNYPIEVGGVSDPNYSIQFVAGQLLIYGRPTHIAIVSGNNQPANPSTALAPFVVQVTDANGDPVPDARVAFEARPPKSGSFVGARHHAMGLTSNAGLAASPVFVLSKDADSFQVFAAVEGVRPVEFSVIGAAPSLTDVDHHKDH